MSPRAAMRRGAPQASSTRGARMFAPLVLLTSMGAPMQCGSEPDPSRRLEETPAEALALLADEFERAGDREARIRTLRFIVQRHPKSREAVDARVTLEELGAATADPTGGTGP